MSRFYAARHNVGQPVRPEELYRGMSVHLSYTNFACVWQVTGLFDKNGVLWMHLRAPQSGKTRTTRAQYARHIRKNEL